MTTTKQSKLGLIFVLASGLLFSFGGLIIKLMPWQALSINAARNLIAVLITLIFMLVIKHKIVFNKSVLLSAAAMAYTTTVFCIANKMTTAANTILLQFTSPVFVILFCWMLWKQKPSKRDIIMCACVFTGILCFFVESLSRGRILGDILALTTGITYAVVFMSNKMKGGDAMSAFLFGEILSGLIGLPFLVKETVFTPQVIGGALTFGCFLGFGYIFMSLGLKHVSPVRANLISALEPVLNPIWVSLFYGEKMTGLAIVGFVIVLASILFFSLRPGKTAPAEITATEPPEKPVNIPIEAPTAD